uniref:Uncharacterized protein n=1 Tax=Meloidogyne enterolobii TaxID=390850 RepID=A0A6V7U7P8_MELEN|nr:unnamed protein product [Meloidogyne enterolobii]
MNNYHFNHREGKIFKNNNPEPLRIRLLKMRQQDQQIFIQKMKEQKLFKEFSNLKIDD